MNKNRKRTKKIRNLVFVCILSAILLTVSTYAWFIGMQTVKVNSFDVKIATTEGLMLSLDGVNWTTELDTKTAVEYSGNQNQWLGTRADDTDYKGNGLIPVSSVGDIDTTKNKLRLFEKASLTATKGGYRLLASEVTNSTSAEADGYLAFDLFIRNMSGEAYYDGDADIDNEEAIYLTYDSDVTVGTSGTQNTGIENSVRVAFAQIGRVENQEYKTNDETYPASIVTGITCATAGKVTGICNRTATIWEPNDKNHINNAAKWYDESCSLRDAADGENRFKYKEKDESNRCGTVTNGTAYPTYAISREITINDAVDVYDGFSFNKYTANTVEPTPEDADDKETDVKYYDEYIEAKTGEAADSFVANDYKLVAVDTFTETERDVKGNERQAFMTLAPNSITKVRVYVYIEGQDIDNYDFAQLGKAIQVNFGFTKERYTNEDFDGDDDEPVSLIPGAEGTQKVAYALSEGEEISDVAATTPSEKEIIWDSETKAFYFVKEDNITVFEFTSSSNGDMTATYAEGKWTFTKVS